MQATGATVATITFDPAETAKLRREEVDHLAYHVARLLTGEATADSEWAHFGIGVELRPA